MTINAKNSQNIPDIPQLNVPPHPKWPELTPAELISLKEKIARLFKEQNAVLVAHYYTDSNLQA